ncbi:MAG: folate-binding protein YgfZ [Pseudohongiellaceae bacterium]|jgi:folate-binding protein YgfZ
MHNHWKPFFSLVSQPQASGAAPTNYIAPLIHYGLLNTVGADAAKFIQGQSSCDIREVSLKKAQYGSFSNPKGRCFANFLISQSSADSFLLRIRDDISNTTQQTLAKYLAFFKAEQNPSEDYLCFGLKGDQAIQNLSQIFDEVPKQTLASSQQNNNHLICIDPENKRYECWVKNNDLETLWPILNKNIPLVDNIYWELDTVRLGLAELSSSTIDMFIPQMLNHQKTGAISFTKGCFTGQEIIARMQYKGKVKRRLYRVEFSSSAIISAGAELFIQNKAQAIGNVVNICPIVQNEVDEQHQFEALAVLTHDASVEQQLFLSDGSTVSISLLALPYSLDNVAS